MKILLAILIASCIPSAGRTTLPLAVSVFPTIDIDTLVPAEPSETVGEVSGSDTFRPIPLSGGLFCDSVDKIALCKAPTMLQAGILVDEQTFAQQNIADQSSLKRVRRELLLAKNLRSQELIAFKQAEAAYQGQIKYMFEKDNSWYERNKMSLSFAAGVVVTGAVFLGAIWAVDQVAK